MMYDAFRDRSESHYESRVRAVERVTQDFLPYACNLEHAHSLITILVSAKHIRGSDVWCLSLESTIIIASCGRSSAWLHFIKYTRLWEKISSYHCTCVLLVSFISIRECLAKFALNKEKYSFGTPSDFIRTTMESECDNIWRKVKRLRVFSSHILCQVMLLASFQASFQTTLASEPLSLLYCRCLRAHLNFNLFLVFDVTLNFCRETFSRTWIAWT